MFRLCLTARALLVLACCLVFSCTRQPPPLPEHVATRTAPLPYEVLRQVKAATALVKVPGGSGSAAWVGTVGNEALIVTNAHVLKAEGKPLPSHAELVFDTHLGVREARQARILAVDERVDLGLLAVEPPQDVWPLALGPARSLESGASLYVSGFPFGVLLGADGELPSATVNPGLSLSVPFWQRTPFDFQPLVAGINPGNSGGPVVDAQGRLRGVAVAHLKGTESSYMVAAEELRRFVSSSLPGARYTWEDVPAPIPSRELPPEPANLKELRRSVVRVRAGSSAAGGFVIGRLGKDLLVLCNRHAVLGESPTPPGKSEVSALGEDGREHKGSGELLRSDASEDLALLRVNGLPDLPALVPDDGTEIDETEPIWVLGLSRPDVQTPSRPEPLRGVVSGRRYDRGVELALLQVDIGINQENTGGPVVDARGRVVGLAVWRHPKTNVSVVIPGLRLKDLLAGALSGGLLAVSHDGVDRCLLQLNIVVDDPLQNLVKAGLVAMTPDAAVYMPEGDRTVVEVGHTLRTAPIHSYGAAEMVAVLDPCHEGTRGFQVWVERADGSRHVSRPFFTQVARKSLLRFRGSYQPGDPEPRVGVPRERTDPIAGWTPSRCAREDGQGCVKACASPTGAMSCVTAGDLSFLGRGGLRLDTEEARRQYARACNAEEVEGCERLLQLYPPGTEGRPTPEAVLALHHRMCELGRLSSCFVETLPRWQPERPAEEVRRAVTSFTEACEGGEPRSCVRKDPSRLEAVGGAQEATFSTLARALPSTPPAPPPPEVPDTPGWWWMEELVRDLGTIARLGPSLEMEGELSYDNPLHVTLKNAFHAQGRCMLSRLGEDPRWMKRPSGSRARVVFILELSGPRLRKSQVRLNTTKNASVSRCLTDTYPKNRVVNGPPAQQGRVILTVDIIR